MNLEKKRYLEKRRRLHIRTKVQGTQERPRLVLTLSNKHAYAQCINDTTGSTLVALSSLSKNLRSEHLKPNKAGTDVLGKQFGALLKEKGIKQVVFDRAGRSYAGCVKLFADAVRSQAIDF